MEADRRSFSKKRPNPQFRKKGGSKRGKSNNYSHEQSLGDSRTSETSYRILCHSRKIGSVIGKGGNIVKALREETQAKITVAESVPGSDERVILIFSPSTKIPRKHIAENNDEDIDTEKEDGLMEPHCAAQDALLKVHDRIIEEDLYGGTENEDNNENAITARLLVPNNTVGCLLGKKGDVIQRLRSETGASIRVLPAEHLPTCAMSTDELVQISGKPAVAKRALYEVSTLLHQNPRKDKPPPSFPVPYRSQGFHPPGPPMADMLPPGNTMWSHRNANSHNIPRPPWMGEYENEPARYGPGGFNDFPVEHGGEAPSEFFIKILCSSSKIGGVIGKGGFNVRQVQQETGASIHVEDVSTESDERVICVSSFEAPWDPRSQTIDAILQLQHKTSEFSEKGVITTRLLVPSSKVGCILGQGGHVINEMRRRTQADIRVYSKEDKPKCAAEDEELVQISGDFGVSEVALIEIASRLRARCLRDAKAGAGPVPVGLVKGFGPPVNLRGRGPPPSGTIGAGSSGEYELLKGVGRQYEPPSYPVRPSSTGYPNFNNAMGPKMPNHAISSIMGTGRSSTSDVAGTRVKLQDPHSGGSQCVVDIRGSSQHSNTAQGIVQAFITSAGPNNTPQRGSYQNFNAQQGAYPNNSTPQTPYQHIDTHQVPYQNYQNTGSQQLSYQDVNAQSSYPYYN